MKTTHLKQRVNSLTEQLSDSSTQGVIRLDYESFSTAEKLLFQKGDQISAEYHRTGNMKLLEENAALIDKTFAVILRRVTELYCEVAADVFSCGVNREVIEYYVKLHFFNFEVDLAECLAHVRTWSEEDRIGFLADLKKNGCFFPRIPRGFNEHNGGSE
jgi:hypothetical protein